VTIFLLFLSNCDHSASLVSLRIAAKPIELLLNGLLSSECVVSQSEVFNNKI